MRHILLKVFCAILKTAPLFVKVSNVNDTKPRASGQSNNLWVEFKSGPGAVSQGFQLSVLSVQGQSGRVSGYLSDYLIPEELGYLVDAIINTGDIASFDSDEGKGNLSQEDKILLSR